MLVGRSNPLSLVFMLGVSVLLAGTARASEPALNLWKPDDSSPGGRQYDARLDRPIEFWAAGMTLAEVFDGVRAQTAVPVSFATPEPDARVRVTLFLNPKRPPTVRELFTQFRWVLDGNFTVSGCGESATYQWLTPPPTDPLAVLDREEREANQRRHEEDMQDPGARRAEGPGAGARNRGGYAVESGGSHREVYAVSMTRCCWPCSTRTAAPPRSFCSLFPP